MSTLTDVGYKMGQVEPEPEEPGDVEPEPAPEPGQPIDDEKRWARLLSLELDDWDNSNVYLYLPVAKKWYHVTAFFIMFWGYYFIA